MIDDEEGKKGMWTSRKQFKKCAPCPFKVCTFFSHTKKKRAHQYTTNHKNGTKKTKQKKKLFQHPTSSQKRRRRFYARPRDIFLCVGLSLCLHPP
jgi:hypothetical protein